KAQIERHRERQDRPHEMLPRAAARRDRGHSHVREPSPRSRRRPGAGSNNSGRKPASLGWRRSANASEASVPREKPSQLANTSAAARLPHWAKSYAVRRRRGASAATRGLATDGSGGILTARAMIRSRP